MKVALIGATGFVGSHLLEELLSRNYEVTAIARDVNKIPLKNEKLHVVSADITNVDALAEALKGNDVVVSAYNAGWSNPNLYNDFLKGSEAIQKAVKQSGVNRLIVVGGGGSLFIDGVQIVDGPDFPEQFKAGATAARDYLNMLKNEAELNWTFFSPALDMFPGTRTGQYRLGTESPVFDNDGESKISVQDAAVAIVDEIEKSNYSRRRFTVGY
ncbi:NAD(P)-dependent oxidoreductase [Dysgonomonas sp. Marseille-P4361]|uniref:NAD(P)-dependent oxidoreductase n=1 Tax=Dysgonomonas sp. Marseille-P4361 TaxID=2161820 RepID=UPI000D54E851|nr:NAD(P)-dependent oxidoreductase [Dysgonomonas sp. Marseille-P4361]